MIERTTVRLPADLLNRAKRKAAAERRTLTSLIEDGLRLVVAESGKVVKRKRRVSKVPVNPALPREFDVVQDIIRKMQLLDRTAAKQVAALLASIFT